MVADLIFFKLMQLSPGLMKLVMSKEVSQLIVPTTANMSMMLPVEQVSINKLYTVCSFKSLLFALASFSV